MTAEEFDGLVKPHGKHTAGKTANGLFEPLRLHIGDGGFFITIMENQYLEKGKAVLMVNPEDAKELLEKYNTNEKDKIQQTSTK